MSTRLVGSVVAAVLIATAIVALPAAALAAPGNGNSAATITVSFGDFCRDFTAHSSKDISHVEIHYADGRVVKDESLHNQNFSLDGTVGNEIDFVIVKSGSIADSFDCESGPAAVCLDGIDNDGNGLVDFPADPGCTSPEDNEESPEDNDDGWD